jgi:hypothetical protein
VPVSRNPPETDDADVAEDTGGTEDAEKAKEVDVLDVAGEVEHVVNTGRPASVGLGRGELEADDPNGCKTGCADSVRRRRSAFVEREETRRIELRTASRGE